MPNTPSNYSWEDCVTQDDFALYYNTYRREEGFSPSSDAEFARTKLLRSVFVTDEIRLSVVQDQRLQDCVCCSNTWDEYTSVLSVEQIKFVGW